MLRPGYVRMQYPPVYKEVDGYKCPEVFFSGLDLMTYDCEYCGRGKHYSSCSITDAQACYGWGHREIGQMSCKGYVQYMEDRKEFL